MKTFLLLSVLLVTHCLNLCAGDNKIYFPTTNFVEIKSKPFTPEIFVGIPRDLYIIKGNLLILDAYEGKHFTSVDLKNPSYEIRIGNKGQGPHDFLRIRGVNYHSGDEVLRVFDEYSRQMSSYKVENRSVVFSESRLKHKVRLPNTTYDVVPLGNFYVANGNFDGKQFALLNEQSEIVETFGVFPGNKDAIGSGLSFYLLNQNRLVVNPQETHFAAAGFMNDHLVFYKQEGNSVKKLKEYFNYDSEATPSVDKSGNGVLYSFSENDNTMRAYIDVYATEGYLYALYLGLSQKELAEEKNHSCYILKFDWNGNLKGGFKADRLLLSVAIDEASGKLYGVTRPTGENESMLVEYNLP